LLPDRLEGITGCQCFVDRCSRMVGQPEAIQKWASEKREPNSGYRPPRNWKAASHGCFYLAKLRTELLPLRVDQGPISRPKDSLEFLVKDQRTGCQYRSVPYRHKFDDSPARHESRASGLWPAAHSFVRLRQREWPVWLWMVSLTANRHAQDRKRATSVLRYTPFTAVTRVQIPPGTPTLKRSSSMFLND
jgi:hypothetical protein